MFGSGRYPSDVASLRIRVRVRNGRLEWFRSARETVIVETPAADATSLSRGFFDPLPCDDPAPSFIILGEETNCDLHRLGRLPVSTNRLLVGGGIEQRTGGGRVGQLDFHDPAIAVGILVDRLGR